ncbi:MAG: TIR domain-containing protein [Candidatus Omnitrophota bacterium]|nr:TIR domain-containing protein [Candidatus Omnitrophota bacterium]
MGKDFRFDIALSFAGEDRDYVEEVAKILESQGIRVYYDRFNQIEAWGKSLPEHFDEIYRKQAQYCVMFISEHYARKVWPNFEKRSALAREVVEAGYILPVRFDDTEILGLPPSKAYIDLRQYKPDQLAQLIMEKLGKENNLKESQSSQSFRRPKVTKSFDPYKECQAWIDYLILELERRNKDSEISFTHFPRDGKQCLRFVVNGKPVYSVNIQLGSLHRDHGLSFSYAQGEMQITSGYNAFAEFEWDKERECVVLKLNDFSAFSFNNSNQNFTQLEFLEYMWGKICDAAEGQY